MSLVDNDPSLQPYKIMVLHLAEYYGHALSANQVIMHAKTLAAAPLDKLKEACLAIMSDDTVTRYPLPATVLAKALPKEPDEAMARTAAARIIAAVRQCGWTNPERARAHIGELGWAVVEMQGGWQHVCETLTQNNLTTYQAQWRDLALGALRQSRAGTLGQAPALPRAVGAPDPKTLTNLLRSIPQIKGEDE